MKLFISYRFTGEDPEELKNEMTRLKDVFEKRGIEISCSFWKEELFRENNYSHKQILEYALNELSNSDIVFAYIKSDQKSEGMLLEIGYALALNKKIILAIKEGVSTTFVKEMSNEVIEFKNFEDLLSKLRESKFVQFPNSL